MSFTPSQLHRVTLTLVNLAADAQEATQARIRAGKSRASTVELAARSEFLGACRAVQPFIGHDVEMDVVALLNERGPRPAYGVELDATASARRTWTAQAVTLLVERWS